MIIKTVVSSKQKYATSTFRTKMQAHIQIVSGTLQKLTKKARKFTAQVTQSTTI